METFEPDVRRYRLILLACGLSALIVPAAFVVLALLDVVAPTGIDALVPALFAYAIGQLPVFVVVRSALRRQAFEALRSADPAAGAASGDAVLQYLRKMTLFIALDAEALAVAGGIVFLLTREWISLTTIAAALVMIVAGFPTRDRWAAAAARLREAGGVIGA